VGKHGNRGKRRREGYLGAEFRAAEKGGRGIELRNRLERKHSPMLTSSIPVLEGFTWSLLE
jgi:hypothetical protein